MNKCFSTGKELNMYQIEVPIFFRVEADSAGKI
jgi:hypothetical protein